MTPEIIAFLACLALGWCAWCWVLVRRHEATAKTSAKLRTVDALHRAAEAQERAVKSDERAAAVEAMVRESVEHRQGEEKRLNAVIARMGMR